MEEKLNIVYTDEPAWTVIGGGVHNYNIEQAGDGGEKNLCFVLQGPDQEIVGGVIGATHWDWFYINLMWIKEEFRGQGYGHRILTMAEDEARQRGAKNDRNDHDQPDNVAPLRGYPLIVVRHVPLRSRCS